MKSDDSITQRRAGRIGRFGDRVRHAVFRTSRTFVRTCLAGDRLRRLGRGLLAAWFLISSLGLPLGGHAGESCCKQTLGVACQCSLKVRLAGECCCKASASKTTPQATPIKASSPKTTLSTPADSSDSGDKSCCSAVKSCCSTGKSSGEGAAKAKQEAALAASASSPASPRAKTHASKPTLITVVDDEICSSGSHSFVLPRREGTSAKRTTERATGDVSTSGPAVSTRTADVGKQELEHENQSSGCPSFRACPCGTEAGGIIVLNQQPRLTASCSTATLPAPTAELSDSPPASFLSVRTAPPVPPPIVLL